MKLEDCYQLGYVTKPHGLNGEIQILIDADNPDQYELMESVFVQQGQNLVPFFLESISISKDKGIVKFEEVDDIEAAKAMKGQALYLPLDTLPELEGTEFYYHEIQGFEMFDEDGTSVGKVINVVDSGLQTLISATHGSGKEVLVPLNDELVVSLDRSAKKLVMKIPEGLMDVYLED